MAFSRIGAVKRLHEGEVELFRRMGTPNYYCKIKIPGIKVQLLSTGTTSELKATAKALGHHTRIAGLVAARKSTARDRKLPLVVDEYVGLVKARGDFSHDDYRRLVYLAKFWKTYLKRFTIRTLSDDVMGHYQAWRKKQGLKPYGGNKATARHAMEMKNRVPADGTVRVENTFL